MAVPIKIAFQISVVGFETAAGRTVALWMWSIAAAKQFRLQRCGDGAGDVVLQLEQILVGPVVMLRPCRRAVLHSDEFGGDAHRIARALYAALEQMRDA